MREKTIMDYLRTENTEGWPVPGGVIPVRGHEDRSVDGNLYLLELARVLRKIPGKIERMRRLQHKIDQIENQRHFDPVTDRAIIDRICQWIGEIARADH